MNKFKARIKLYISLLVAIAIAVVTVITITAYKGLDVAKPAIISGSIGGFLSIVIVIFFFIDRHNSAIFLKGEKLEFVIKKFYYDEVGDPIGYDFELLEEPGEIYHRNAIVLFYGLEPDMFHGYAYVLDNNLQVDDDSLFKIEKEIENDENSWNQPNENLETSTEENPEEKTLEDIQEPVQQTPPPVEVKKDYNDDVVIVDDDPTERKVEDPVKKIVDQDGDDDWSRAI